MAKIRINITFDVDNENASVFVHAFMQSGQIQSAADVFSYLSNEKRLKVFSELDAMKAARLCSCLRLDLDSNRSDSNFHVVAAANTLAEMMKSEELRFKALVILRFIGFIDRQAAERISQHIHDGSSLTFEDRMKELCMLVSESGKVADG